MKYRDFLKGIVRKEIDFSTTAQNRGLPPPPVEKPCPPGSRIIPLVSPDQWKGIREVSVIEAIGKRKSIREYSSDAMKVDEISFLLWAVQGIRSKVISGGHAFRTVPSAGCRHSFETYIAIFRVEGVEKGIYRYLPLSHGIVLVKTVRNLEVEVTQAAMGQSFAGESALTFIWTTIPSRMEWRYGEASYKVIALDAGHVCQNLYIACSAVGAGTCAIAAYDQEKTDELLGVDGEEEFVIYMAPVGKPARW